MRGGLLWLEAGSAKELKESIIITVARVESWPATLGTPEKNLQNKSHGMTRCSLMPTTNRLYRKFRHVSESNRARTCVHSKNRTPNPACFRMKVTTLLAQRQHFLGALPVMFLSDPKSTNQV